MEMPLPFPVKAEAVRLHFKGYLRDEVGEEFHISAGAVSNSTASSFPSAVSVQ